MPAPENFPADAVLRRVVSEALVGLSAPRVLLMQAAHPVAFAGFFAHTGALDDPYERLNRTTLIMNTVAFGTEEHAARATARVRAMHARVSGTLAEPRGRGRPGHRTPRTIPTCCCGSSRRWPTAAPRRTASGSGP